MDLHHLRLKCLEYGKSIIGENGFDIAAFLLIRCVKYDLVKSLFLNSRPEYVENAFNVQLVEHQANLPGVISRKKQVVPAITRAINA